MLRTMSKLRSAVILCQRRGWWMTTFPPKEETDWRWKTNYFKNCWNKLAFGNVRRVKLKAYHQPMSRREVASDPEPLDPSTAFWLGLSKRREAKMKARLRARKPMGDTLEAAIASASSGLHQETLRVPDLPCSRIVPKEVAAKPDVPKTEELSLLLGVPYDNPMKEVLTKEVVLTMDPEATRRQIKAFQLRGKGNTGALPSVTRILSETMPPENRKALQVSCQSFTKSVVHRSIRILSFVQYR